MVHPYLQRRQGLEPVTYPSEDVRKALERTLGVPIFQEQVMQVAILAAGFTAGEADELRRSMAAWKRKGGLEKFHDKMIDGMTRGGYDPAFAEQIFRQIQGFGEYGFPESHAASFALLAYASCWLKRHEPEAFLAAMLNSRPMGFYSPSTLVQDARRHGVRVLNVDIMKSSWNATLEPVDNTRPAVLLGMNQIKGMRPAAAGRIEAARGARPFPSTADLARRAELDRHDLDVLAGADALRFVPSTQLRRQPNRRLVRAAGIVTGRQQPRTAGGVVFVTLEDEHGQINLIVRLKIAARYRDALLNAQLLGASGVWQSASGVQHLIVGHMADLTHLLDGLVTKSRDFH